jgi:DamX protein
MKKNIYFEPPSRLQLLDKLRHFVRFSDFLLIVSGGRGAGKSTLLSQLRPDEGDNTLNCCFVSPEAEVGEQQLLELLIAQFPSHEQGGTGFADQLKVFHLQLKAMQASGVKCLIAVDDAELLSDSALNLLLNLHAADAQLLLVSENEYALSLLDNSAVKHMEGRVHHLVIEGMLDGEAAEYLELCHPAVASLPDKKKNDLIRLAEGMPGRIETLLAGGKVTKASPVGKRSAFPLPGMHMVGIAALLVGIVVVSLLKFLPEEQIPAELVSEERVSMPLSVDVKAANEVLEAPVLSINERSPSSAKDETVPSANDSVASSLAADPVKLDLAARLKEQELLLRKNKVPALEVNKEKPAVSGADAVVTTLEDDLRAVVEENSPAAVIEKAPSVASEVVVATVLPKPKPKPKPKPQIKSVSVHESVLLGWPAKGYTLQMLGARSKASALDFIAGQSDASQFYYFETIYKGLPWHVVVYGQYVNRDIANASIRKLPKELQKIKPWARSVQGVQIDIRKKKIK